MSTKPSRTPEARRAQRAEKKEAQLAAERAQGITRQPGGRPPKDHHWDERLGEWVLDALPAATLPIAAVTTAMANSSVADSSASASTAAAAPGRPSTASSDLPADSWLARHPRLLAAAPVATIEITNEELRFVYSLRQSAEKSDATRRQARSEAAQPQPASPETAAALALDAQASLVRKLKAYLQHCEACWAFEQRERPSDEVIERFHALRARAGFAPTFNPQPEEQRKHLTRPNPPLPLCDECIEQFEEIQAGEIVGDFEPCADCLEYERMLCQAGGAYPCDDSEMDELPPAVALPPYLLDRAANSTAIVEDE